MNCSFCGAPISPMKVACDRCLLAIAEEVKAEAVIQFTGEPEGEAKTGLSDSDKAREVRQCLICGNDIPQFGGILVSVCAECNIKPDEREATIHADVFRPDETDLDYMRRRRRELGM